MASDCITYYVFEDFSTWHVTLFTLPSAKLLVIFFKDFFFMWIIFKVFIEFVTLLLLFYVLDFGLEACWILSPQPGIVADHTLSVLLIRH